MTRVTETGQCFTATTITTTVTPTTSTEVQLTRYVRLDDAEVGSVTTEYNAKLQTMYSTLRRGKHGPITFSMTNLGTQEQAWAQHEHMQEYAENNLYESEYTHADN